MLLDVDFTALEKYLQPSKKKLESKGVESVASRVINLCELKPDLTYQMFNDALINQFENKHQDRDIHFRVLTTESLKNIDKIMEIYERLHQWEWRFGASPEFTHTFEPQKFPWALMDINLNVKNGIIQHGTVYSDSLIPEFIDTINEILCNTEHNIEYNEKGIVKFAGMFL